MTDPAPPLPAAAHAYQTGNYLEAAQVYEQAIESEPTCLTHYWYLGLMYLLQNQAETAQATWLMALFTEDTESTAVKQAELLEILEQAALFQAQQQQLENAQLIRQQIQELDPENVHNIGGLLWLSLQNKTYTSTLLAQANMTELLQNSPHKIDGRLLWTLTQELLNVDAGNPDILPFLQVALPAIQRVGKARDLANLLLEKAMQLGYLARQPRHAAQLALIARQLKPEDPEVLQCLSGFYQEAELHDDAIATAQDYLTLVKSLPDRIYATRNLLKAYAATGGQWDQVQTLFLQLEQLLAQLLANNPQNLSFIEVFRLINATYFAPYCRDAARQNRELQNRVIQLCQTNVELNLSEKISRYHQGHRERFLTRDPQKKLRIGFISFCLKRHSVGWLARSLFQYHNHEKYDIYLYLVGEPDISDPLQDWYLEQADQVTRSTDVAVLSEAIFDHEIDILIELDSLTIDVTCSTVMLKPAPIQATWLGWDASGIPTIDYFLVDQFALPHDAQDYYSEKLLRLPHAFIGLDGFEVGVPTLGRADFDIPNHALVYYSVQKGYKRNPDLTRLQLEILKQVPESYFCIKGSFDTKSLQNAFLELADEVGVDRDRLKFLGVDSLESVHRANMGVLADIVLDTYPYNGATTTLETLWMGIPLVTWVGEQFAARNSYSLLNNVGVEVGIAHNAEEYVTWGIKLGTEPELRQKVTWRLQQSRRDSPLWQGRQFAREMEDAYEQMWSNYVATMTAVS